MRQVFYDAFYDRWVKHFAGRVRTYVYGVQIDRSNVVTAIIQLYGAHENGTPLIADFVSRFISPAGEVKVGERFNLDVAAD